MPVFDVEKIQFDNNAPGGSLFDASQVTFDKEDGTWLGDVGRAWGKGTGDLIRSGGLALSKLGMESAGASVDDFGKETADYYQGYTPETAAALNKKFVKDDGTINTDLTLEDVARKAAIGAFASGPAQVPMALIGGALAKATMKAVPLIARGMAPVIESAPVQAVLNNPLARKVLDSGAGKFLFGETAGTTAEMAQGAAQFAARGMAFGASEGITSGLGNAVQVGDEVRKAPLEAYMPQEYKEYGFTEGVPAPPATVIDAAKKAREDAANRAENEVIWKTALVDMAVSIPTGGGAFGELSQLPTGMFGRGVKRGLISSGIRGGMRGGTKESVQEFFQSGGESRVQDVAKINAGVPGANTSIFRDLNQAVEGAVTGGLSGGVLGGAGHISQHGAFKTLAEADLDLKNERNRLGLAYEIGNSLPTVEEKKNWAENSSAAIALGLPIDLNSELFLTEMNRPRGDARAAAPAAPAQQQSGQQPNQQPAVDSSIQNESYDDLEDMGPLQRATTPATTATTADDADNIPSFTPPSTPVNPEPVPPAVVQSGMAPTSQAVQVTAEPVREITEADQVDFENAVKWAQNLERQGKSAIPEIPEESERDYAWRLLEEYRKVITPAVARDSAASAVQSDNEQAQPQQPPVHPAVTALAADNISGLLTSLGYPKIRNADHFETGGIGASSNGIYTSPPMPPQVADALSQKAAEAGLSPVIQPYIMTRKKMDGTMESVLSPNGRVIVTIQPQQEATKNGVTDTLSELPGTTSVDGVGLALPQVQSENQGYGSDNNQSGGEVDGSLQPVSQESSEGQTSLSDLREEDVANVSTEGEVIPNGNQEKTGDEGRQEGGREGLLDDTVPVAAPVAPAQVIPVDPAQAKKAEAAAKFAMARLKALNKKLAVAKTPEEKAKATELLDAHLATIADVPVTVSTQATKPNNTPTLPDTSKDNMIVAAAKLGGISLEQIDKEYGFEKIKKKVTGAGRDLARTLNTIVKSISRNNPHVIHTNGRELDDMRRALIDNDYLPDGADINDMLVKLSDAAGGRHSYSTHNDGQMAEAAYHESAKQYSGMLDSMTDGERQQHLQRLEEQYTELKPEDIADTLATVNIETDYFADTTEEQTNGALALFDSIFGTSEEQTSETETAGLSSGDAQSFQTNASGETSGETATGANAKAIDDFQLTDADRPSREVIPAPPQSNMEWLQGNRERITKGLKVKVQVNGIETQMTAIKSLELVDKQIEQYERLKECLGS